MNCHKNNDQPIVQAQQFHGNSRDPSHSEAHFKMDEGLLKPQFTSEITLAPLGISVQNVPRHCQILYSDRGPHFTHVAKVQALSKAFANLRRSKQSWRSLIHVRTSLQVMVQLQNLLKVTSSLCNSLSKMSDTLNTSKTFNTIVLDLIERIKESTECTSQLSDLLQSNLSERHSEKTKTRLIKLNNMAIHSLHLDTVVKYIRNIIQKFVAIRSLPVNALHPEILSHSQTFTEAVFHCHCFLRSVQELLITHDSNFPGKWCPISKCTTLVNVDLDCGYALTSYIKDLAGKRSAVIAKDICACVSRSLNKNDICLVSESTEEVNNNTIQWSTSTKKAIKWLRKEYCKIVRSETDYIVNLSSDMTSLHCNDIFIQRRKSMVKNKSLKPIEWFFEKSEPLTDALSKLYSEHLWNCVGTSMKNIYLASSSSDILNRISYAEKTFRSVLTSCVAKLRGDDISVDSIEPLSLLILVSFAYNNLQMWDHDFCKAMASLPKDKFRYVSPNPSIPSSQTLKMVLENQIRQNSLHADFKSILKKSASCELKDGYSLGMFSGTVIVPLNIFLDFIVNSLQYKRQQFLAAGNWEQFFVLTSGDVHPILKFLESVIETLEKNFFDINDLLSGANKQLKAKRATIQSFESSGFKMFFRVFRYKSKNCLEVHLPKGKVWRRRGSNCLVLEPNPYVNTIGNILFLPLLDSLNCLPKGTWFDVVQKCIENFIRVWMDFILGTQMMFSWCGANQLRLDFEHFLLWFEQDQFSQLWDEFREWQPIDAVKDMRSAVVLLMCQPHGSQSNQFRDMRESLSSISEASVDSFTGDQFDQAVQEIELHDKERWLALRVKSNKKKFLCLS